MSTTDRKIRLGIIRGGSGEHYERSLKEGGLLLAQVLENLSHKFLPVDIFVDKDCVWHMNGLPIKMAELPSKVEMIWDATYPSSSLILQNLGMPVYSVPFFAHSINQSKEMLREHMQKIGVNIPNSFVIPAYQEDIDGEKEKFIIKKAKEVFEKFSSPWTVKSFYNIPDMGIHIAKTFPELVFALRDAIAHDTSILVEEYIEGKRGGVHSVAGFRNQDLYSLPPLEIKDGSVASVSNFTNTEKEKLSSLVRDIHEHLGVEHYLYINFVFNKNRGLFIDNISFMPCFEKDSHLSSSCLAIGAKDYVITEHILDRLSFGRVF